MILKKGQGSLRSDELRFSDCLLRNIDYTLQYYVYDLLVLNTALLFTSHTILIQEDCVKTKNMSLQRDLWPFSHLVSDKRLIDESSEE